MEDERKLSDYDIQEGGIVHLTLPSDTSLDVWRNGTILIFLNIQPHERTIQIRIKATETVGSLMNHFENREWIPQGEQYRSAIINISRLFY